MRKLFKGGNYSRAETIRGNTVFFFEFGSMYCDLWSKYIKVQKLFNGRNYVFCLNQDLSRIGELLGVSDAKQADDYIKATT